MLTICRHGGGGGDCTVSVTATDCWLVPPLFVIVKEIVSVYVPALRLAIEGLMVTLCDAPAFRVLLVGLILSQPEPLAVDTDHAPVEPQLVIVIACGAGSAWP